MSSNTPTPKFCTTCGSTLSSDTTESNHSSPRPIDPTSDIFHLLEEDGYYVVLSPSWIGIHRIEDDQCVVEFPSTSQFNCLYMFHIGYVQGLRYGE